MMRASFKPANFFGFRAHADKPGTLQGLVLVRLRDPGGNELVKKVSAVVGEISNWAGYFVVLTDHKIRVKRSS